MFCVMGRGECTGCMECQQPKPVMKSESGEVIYEGDTYYDFGGMIVTEDELEDFKKIAKGENE